MFKVLREVIVGEDKFSVVAIQDSQENNYISALKIGKNKKINNPVTGVVVFILGLLFVATSVLLTKQLAPEYYLTLMVTIPVCILCVMLGATFISKQLSFFTFYVSDLYVKKLFPVSHEFDKNCQNVETYLNSMDDKQFYEMVVNAHKVVELEKVRDKIEGKLKDYSGNDTVKEEAINRLEEISAEIHDRNEIRHKHERNMIEISETIILEKLVKESYEID